MLPACATTKEPVIRTETVEVRVPVFVPCVNADNRPERVVPLNERMSREEWDALSTDQREFLLTANGERRIVYENEAEVIFVLCDQPTPDSTE